MFYEVWSPISFLFSFSSVLYIPSVMMMTTFGHTAIEIIPDPMCSISKMVREPGDCMFKDTKGSFLHVDYFLMWNFLGINLWIQSSISFQHSTYLRSFSLSGYLLRSARLLFRAHSLSFFLLLTEPDSFWGLWRLCHDQSMAFGWYSNLRAERGENMEISASLFQGWFLWL